MQNFLMQTINDKENYFHTDSNLTLPFFAKPNTKMEFVQSSGGCVVQAHPSPHDSIRHG